MPRHYVLHPAFCHPSVILVSAIHRVGSILATGVLTRGGQVRHGVQNWVCVSCAPRDIHSGAYSTRQISSPGCLRWPMNVRRYYGVILPSLLVLTTGVGFCSLNCILGGQALASIANISWT